MAIHRTRVVEIAKRRERLVDLHAADAHVAQCAAVNAAAIATSADLAAMPTPLKELVAELGITPAPRAD